MLKNNDTHKRNVNKLFNRFQDEGISNYILNDGSNVDDYKNKNEVLAAIKVLKGKIGENLDSIETILTLRNKVFAHTDPDDPEETTDIDIYTTLVELSNEIYNTLFGKILGVDFNPNITNRYNLMYLIDLFE